MKSHDKQVFTETGMSEVHALREKVVREELARRLRGVCGNLTDDDFKRLVHEMAARQVRDERRSTW